MKNQFIFRHIWAAIGLLFTLLLVRSSFATETNYYYAATEGQPPSTTWPAIWTNAVATTGTAPVANGIYITLYDGTQLGESTTTPTQIRNPYGHGTEASPLVFPGDSLVLSTNTRWILKENANSGQVQTNLAGTTGVSALTVASPTFNFPGANGQMGLVFNGGALNPGDSGWSYTITGTIQAAPGSTSYVFAGGTPLGTPTSPSRSVNLAGQLSGSGKLVLGSSPNNVPGLQVTGAANNAFTGGWIVQAGWLQGIGDGTQDGYNSLGTNASCTIVVDPNYVYPTGTGSNYFSAAGEVTLPNNSLLDLGSSLMNSAGTLILTNNGQMWLHGHYVFSAVTINGTVLTNGYYSYATLTSSFPNNFTGLPSVFTTFGGDITVQAAGPAPAYAPQFSLEPVNISDFNGDTAVFSTSVTGLQPVSYRWYTVDSTGTIFSQLSNGGEISGATSNTLTIADVMAANETNYVLIASNSLGTATSSVVTLTVNPIPASITLNYNGGTGSGAQLMTIGSDWNSTGYWWDGTADGGLSASTLVTLLPGVPFEVPPGSTLRTPNGALSSTFPGGEVVLDGDGNFVNTGGNVGNTVALLACKQGTSATNTGEIYFTNLVINGGEVDNGVTSVAVIDGGMTIGPNNAFFYVGPTAVTDTGFQINSVISGSGLIEVYLYAASSSYMPNFTNDVDITGVSNPFTGTWEVAQGVLLGSGLDSLGTNSIQVDSNGALETLYDIKSSNATLTLNGQLFLHQNDTFASVTVAGVSLPPGTYTAAQLTAYSAANFPATWTQKYGSTSNTASGTLTVLAGSGSPLYISGGPQSLSLFVGNNASFGVLAGGLQPLYYQWQAGITGSGGPYTNLTDGGQISGSTTSTLTISNINLNNALDYVVVVSNSYGTMVSSPATLTVNPIPPSIILGYAVSGTGGVLIPMGSDWNSPGYWWDGTYDGGLPASMLASLLPGVPFVAPPGATLRTPNGALTSTFPGSEVVLEGDGNFINTGGSVANTVSLLACKQGTSTTNTGEIYFTNLVINGGEVDDGVASVAVIDGGMTIGTNNAYFYVGPTAVIDTGFQINSVISGSGTIQIDLYAASSSFMPTFTNDVDITGVGNPFTGTWLVEQGPLLGSGLNSLGTNSIDVETNGVLETLYDLNDPSASLTLNGEMYLHQHDTFDYVSVGTNVLNAGTYTAAQLNAAYPANFPNTWAQLYGSTYSSSSGSLTVLQPSAAPVTLQFQASNGNLTLSWSQGQLLQATNVLGPWVTNLAASPPSYTVATTNAQMYFRIKVSP